MNDATHIEERASAFRSKLETVRSQIAKAIVGHEKVVEEMLVCLCCGGHALVEGVPGLGKTSLIKALGEALSLETSRIQFTPDLMPADIIGTNILAESSSGERAIVFRKGPVFTQILLADEINRATPKTQAALLEAMQEQGVTVSGVRYPLDPPFIVLATQNPLEMEGTYPLPEAQLDRFFFKLEVRFPDSRSLMRIIDRTTGEHTFVVEPVLSRDEILEMQRFVRHVPIPEQVKEYAINLVMATHPTENPPSETVTRYVRYGSSPRGAQSLVLAGKVYALIDGRLNVDFVDIRKAALPALRHRIILDFAGEAEGITAEQIIQDIIERVRYGG